MKLEWAISGKYDMESTCGRFKILDRVIVGTRGYVDVLGRRIVSRRLYILDKKQGKTHVLLPIDDPTSFARRIMEGES